MRHEGRWNLRQSRYSGIWERKGGISDTLFASSVGVLVDWVFGGSAAKCSPKGLEKCY